MWRLVSVGLAQDVLDGLVDCEGGIGLASLFLHDRAR